MKLYVLRHGQSPSCKEANVASDAQRPLSAQGRSDARASAQLLKEKGATVAMVLASPLLRAQQTAREALAILQPTSGLKTYQPLSNELSGEELLAAVYTDFPKAQELLLIGHQPQLGDLVHHVAGKTVELRPAGIVALDTASGGILWSRNP